jgi:hypothetical protein
MLPGCARSHTLTALEQASALVLQSRADDTIDQRYFAGNHRASAGPPARKAEADW